MRGPAVAQLCDAAQFVDHAGQSVVAPVVLRPEKPVRGNISQAKGALAAVRHGTLVKRVEEVTVIEIGFLEDHAQIRIGYPLTDHMRRTAVLEHKHDDALRLEQRDHQASHLIGEHDGLRTCRTSVPISLKIAG